MVGSSATVQKSLCLREMGEEPATTEDMPGVYIAQWEQEQILCHPSGHSFKNRNLKI